ncbi:MAG: pectate lyase [Verrucomicrobia bacterium]|nr:pectate lyase [Verrucomicrobiota bacterium]
MKRATAFMTGKVAVHGGYVWSYLPDGSRRWGEMEARPSMIWLQAPGTASMGHAFLDALHATGDAYFYRAAASVGDALIAAQHPAGGWHYIHDFAGEQSLREWYATVGRNGWRLEEYQHYYGNATFDDSTTTDCAEFMLRLYLEQRDPRYRDSLSRAIEFVLKSQFPTGGWPQRYPPAGGFSKDGLPDYTGCITFNDDVIGGNVDFLLKVQQSGLGGDRVLAAIRRGMDIFTTTQQPAPQAGWSLQHTLDHAPAGARTYEPKSLATHTTASCVKKLLEFHRLTGDPKYLARVPEALDWLDSVKLPPDTPGARGSHPTFVELGTNQPLYLHRRGSNVVNGRYFADHDSRNTIGHYSSFRSPDVAGLRASYAEARALAPDELAKNSPLKPGRPPGPLAKYFSVREDGFGARFGGQSGTPAERAARVIASLDADGRWLAPLFNTSHPYTRDGAKEIAPGDFRSTQVGDETDTSPFRAPQPVNGISTGTFIRNLGVLIRFLDASP